MFRPTRLAAVSVALFCVAAHLAPSAAGERPEVARLLEQLKADDLYVRCQAVTGLGELGPGAAAAVPASDPPAPE